jgi:hypothetical protein
MADHAISKEDHHESADAFAMLEGLLNVGDITPSIDAGSVGSQKVTRH